MAIKLEVGKKYELNNGEVYGCTKVHGDDPLAVDYSGYGPFVIDGMLYHQDGTFAGRDAIQEYRGVKRCVDDVQPDATDDAPKLWRDMTPEEKGALLLAHHEGKVIEWSGVSAITGEFTVWDKCDDDCLWDGTHLGDGFAYRVQPDPVRETVTLYGKGRKWRCVLVEDFTHRITFDTIDGKPDLTSIKMEEV